MWLALQNYIAGNGLQKRNETIKRKKKHPNVRWYFPLVRILVQVSAIKTTLLNVIFEMTKQ